MSSFGDVQYDAVIKQNLPTGVVIYSSPKDLAIKSALARPDEESINHTTNKTKAALEKLLEGKLTRHAGAKTKKEESSTYVRYTPAASNETNRIIKVQDVPIDPLEPARFKAKKTPNFSDEPTAPILHSPPRKLTKDEAAVWKIPPVVSSWKNPKGYTIPLDKRLAADGRELEDNSINDNFAKLSEYLYLAERDARKEIEELTTAEKKVMTKQKEIKEQELRALAAKARERRVNFNTEEELEEKIERDEIRNDRKRDRRHEINLMGTKKYKATRERDVIEQIALTNKGVPISKDTMFDSRLFNRSEGVTDGFGHDEDYNIYTKPLFQTAGSIYRPTKMDDEVYGGGEKAGLGTRTFQADKPFEGTAENKGKERVGPVEFEIDKADPYGIDKFLSSHAETK